MCVCVCALSITNNCSAYSSNTSLYIFVKQEFLLKFCKIKEVSLLFSETSKRRGFLGSLFHRSSGASPTSKATPTTEATPTSETTPPPVAPPEEEVKMVKVPRCRSNAMLLSLGSLAQEPANVREGEVESCLQCGAVISSLSCLTSSNGVTLWTW